ncbi:MULTISPECIES: 1-deoxy-D-xylulose-5-phosphate reductoisomerase [unclassified Helicobacter]|uniref:1-deoxy-D-xylulose-5-phosphate reductoisomerase n=1 Tax=unclassified Helicobacter TaxID=2593540 RepID=UPI000CF15370|nr:MULTISPECIES: 1-deoxy-D-xylulose-5-phosphate reductoisomerase [unclassified Helicobacter]
MVLLGSTGSIGINTLKIARKFHIPVEVLCAGRNITLLNQQIKEFQPKIVVIADKEDYHKLHYTNARVLFGQEGIVESIRESKSHLVVNALVGFNGLYPSYVAMECQKKLALANKESLVSGGWLFENFPIVPIDSEHFGIWYLINNRPIEQIIITASGGAFRDLEIEKIKSQKSQQALQHPNWKMGKKITIDSATMANKLLEVLEAKWIFNHNNITALIERTSSVHALLNFKDGSSTAHFAKPDMQLPIAYALDPIQAKQQEIITPICFEKLNSLAFEKIDTLRYPLWILKDELLKNPHLGIVFNASNEVLVELFLQDRICFGDIADNIFRVFDTFIQRPKTHLIGEIVELDKEVRLYTQNLIK